MKDSAAAADRRDAPRIPGPFDASYEGQSGRRSVRVSDLSETGCFVETLEPMVPGTRVELRLDLSGWGPIDLIGEVQYTSAHLGFGVHFVDVPEATARVLHVAIGSPADKI